MGFLNNYINEDSANRTVYNPKDLIKLEELGYIDMLKYNPNKESDRYTGSIVQKRGLE